MRTTPSVKAALQEAADREGRSLAQEIEQRLERSLQVDVMLGGPATSALITAIVADVVEIEARTGSRWNKDILTFGAVRHAIMEHLADAMPIPEEYREEARQVSRRFEAIDSLDGEDDQVLQAASRIVDRTKQLIDTLSQKAEPGAAIWRAIDDDRRARASLRRAASRGA
jgi:hypothetical protein